ncbi:MAG: hypothetical protein JWQ38_1983 [Flavipsychrobacter sp.]|nr:hypothetical protein [Flavipsychrobacter sp.]
MKFNSSVNVSAILLILIALTSACRKENKTTVVPPVTPTGNEVVFYPDKRTVAAGDTVHFTFISKGYIVTNPAGIDGMWYFGDGDSSKLSAPYHVYTAAGVNNVILTISDTSYHVSGARNPVTVWADPLYTKTICKTRLWQGEQKTTQSGANNSESSRLIHDTLFSFTYIDRLTIENMTYAPGLSDSNHLVYSNGIEELHYNTVTDSVYYYSESSSYDHTGREFYLQPTTLTKVQVWYHAP